MRRSKWEVEAAERGAEAHRDLRAMFEIGSTDEKLNELHGKLDDLENRLEESTQETAKAVRFWALVILLALVVNSIR